MYKQNNKHIITKEDRPDIDRIYRYAWSLVRLTGGPAERELGYLCDVCIGGHNLNYLRKLRYIISLVI